MLSRERSRVSNRDLEPLALLADAIRGRNADVVEGQLRGRRAADAHLVLDARGGETGAVGLDDERAHPLPTAGGRIGQGEDGHDVRHRAVGDESLRPVEDVLVTVARGPHPVRGHIRAGGGLGQGEGDQPLAAGESREVSVLLLVGAGQEDRQRAELLDDRDQAGRRVGASDLLDEDRLRDRVEVRPAVTLLEARAEQVLLGQEVLEVVRETPPSRRSPPPAARCAPPPARARRHAARRARRWAGRSRGLLAAKFGGTGSGTVKSSRCEVHP